LADQKSEEKWIVLKGEVGDCSSCVIKNNCKQIKTYIKHCIQAKYRFRCPIEVLDQRLEDEQDAT